MTDEPNARHRVLFDTFDAECEKLPAAGPQTRKTPLAWMASQSMRSGHDSRDLR
jgi:hypothetical protein